MDRSKQTERRSTAEWQWRLDAFDALPAAISSQDKDNSSSLGSMLYLSADRNVTPPLPTIERVNRLKAAIEKLDLALRLERRPGRDELPSHLYNTLGVAHSRYADLLDDEGHGNAADEQWDMAWQSFRSSMRSRSFERRALLAFSVRLIHHARETIKDHPDGTMDDVTRALELLDEAQDVIDHHPNAEPNWDQSVAESKAECLGLVDSAGGLEYALALQRGDNPAIGYVCEARLALRDPNNQSDIDRAIDVLDRAGGQRIELGERGMALRLMLARRSARERFDFALQLKLHESLEKAQRQSYRPLDNSGMRFSVIKSGAFRTAKSASESCENNSECEQPSSPESK